jgi:RimJ/RimL family protein N-acetyltransferase
MNRVISTSQGAVEIRAARMDDALAFRELRLEALRSHPEVFGSDYASSLNHSLEYWIKRMRGEGDDKQTMFFGVHNDALIGMTSIRRGRSVKTQHSAVIGGVYVRPAWRGQGVADALIGACREWAQACAVRLLKLGVVVTNTPAIRCYLRFGFTVYGVEPQVIFHDGVYYDELLMACRI